MIDFERTPLSRRALLKGATAVGVAGLVAPAPSRILAQEDLKIAFSVPGLNFPFFVHMMNIAKEYSAELGGIELIELDGQEAGQPSSSKQSADLEAMITEGVDGVIISPNDVAALGPAIQSVLDAGIPVVTVDRNVTDVPTFAHVGADNVEGGRIQGRYLIEILPEGGDIFELQGATGASPAIDRHAGLAEVLDAQDLINVVVSQTGSFTRAGGLTVTESALAANPNPVAVVAANDEMAFGAAEVLAANDLDIPVVGFDALPEALQAIVDGSLDATIDQFPGQQVRGAFDVLVAKLRDGVDPEAHDIYITPALITADNLADAERAEEAGVLGDATPAA
jgi:ABC-type sugar transport system substrate-binding protein